MLLHHHIIHIDISVGSLLLSMLATMIVCIGLYIFYRYGRLKQFNATILAEDSMITNVGIKYQSSTINTPTTAAAVSTEYNLVRKPSYRIEEERSKLSSSEFTRRGLLWSKRASWNLPTIKRQKHNMIYNHATQAGVELIK